MLQTSTLSQLFDPLAENYDRHAALEQEVGRRLLERCEFRRSEPRRILDAGCATGELAANLKRQFRKAQVIGLDVAPSMLGRLRRRSRLLHRISAVCGDLGSLPLVDASVDLLCSNLALHWSSGLRATLEECGRVLRPAGMLLFATLGRGSLAELRDAWPVADQAVRFLDFPDALQLGDAMLASGLVEPVVDTERIRLEYPDLEAMVREFEATGSSLLIEGWERWRNCRHELESALAAAAGNARPSISFEIVYGTAFGPPTSARRPRQGPDVLSIPVDSLLPSRPMG